MRSGPSAVVGTRLSWALGALSKTRMLGARLMISALLPLCLAQQTSLRPDTGMGSPQDFGFLGDDSLAVGEARFCEQMASRIPISAYRWVEYVACLQDRCEDSVLCDEMENITMSGCQTAFSGGKTREKTKVCILCPLSCRRCGPDPWIPPAVVLLGMPCENGWSYIDGHCIKLFHVNNTWVDWDSPRSVRAEFWKSRDQANEHCFLQGGALASGDTRPKMHMIFEVVRRGSRYLSRQRTRAWIGLRSAVDGTCTTTRLSGWTWANGKPLTFHAWGDPISAMQEYESPNCNGGENTSHCVMVNWRSETYTWADTPCENVASSGHSYSPTWVCEKKARYREIPFLEECKAYGLLDIDDANVCEAATRNLYLAVPAILLKFISDLDDGSDVPFVCEFAPRRNWPLIMKADTLEKDKVYTTFRLCNPAPDPESQNSTNLFDDWVEADSQVNEGMRPVTRFESFDPKVWMNILSCCAAYGLVAMAIVAKLPAIRRVARNTMPAVRRLLHPWQGSSEAALAKVLMPRRRWQLSVGAFTAMLIWELQQLTMVVFLPGGPCKPSAAELDAGDPRQTEVWVRLASVAAMLLYLVAMSETVQAQTTLPMALVALGLRLATSSVNKERSLLTNERIISEILWRITLGLGVPVRAVLIVNVAYSFCFTLVFYAVIPTGSIVLNTSSTGFAIFGSRCPLLWSVNDLVSYLRTVNRLMNFAQISVALGGGANSEAPMAAVQPLLLNVMRQVASVQDFAASEAIICIIVGIALVGIGHLMSKQLVTAALFKNSDSLLRAASQILESVCDCVVRVDADFTIISSTERLANILLTPKDLRGASFKNRIVQEHRARFEETLNTETSSMDQRGMGEALVISLKDSFGMPVQCQLFHTKFTDFSGAVHYIFGLNELGERPIREFLEDHFPRKETGGGESDQQQVQEDEGAVAGAGLGLASIQESAMMAMASGSAAATPPSAAAPEAAEPSTAWEVAAVEAARGMPPTAEASPPTATASQEHSEPQKGRRKRSTPSNLSLKSNSVCGSNSNSENGPSDGAPACPFSTCKGYEKHKMEFTSQTYQNFFCSICRKNESGTRWHCKQHESDLCSECAKSELAVEADFTVVDMKIVDYNRRFKKFVNMESCEGMVLATFFPEQAEFTNWLAEQCQIVADGKQDLPFTVSMGVVQIKSPARQKTDTVEASIHFPKALEVSDLYVATLRLSKVYTSARTHKANSGTPPQASSSGSEGREETTKTDDRIKSSPVVVESPVKPARTRSATKHAI
mmetsp:Transcript_103640/g.332189  ORF Transcript_103640/g.332189 Transcript_103640/m.332189 type:complete len:1266 (+) Transcript_103640:86-3883(+)